MGAINDFINSFDVEVEMPMPKDKTLDGYVNAILNHIRPFSEDLREQQFYTNKAWMEIRDDERFHDVILHFFNDGGKYMIVTNGDIRNGNWKYMSSANKLILSAGKGSEMYDLAYMDKNFFILKKHGEHKKFGRREYRLFAFEPVGRKLEWRDMMEMMFNQYRTKDNNYVSLMIIVIVIVAIIIMFSLF